LSAKILETILKDQHKGYRRPALINRLTARPLTRTMHKMHRASQDNYYSDSFIQGTYDAVTDAVTMASIESDRIRRITPREALRIQGFTETAIDAALTTGVSDTQLYMQAGNAVPPPLVEAVLGHLILPGRTNVDAQRARDEATDGRTDSLAVA
jgi:DNA (cytosine-5)-methyltransferase 1